MNTSQKQPKPFQMRFGATCSYCDNPAVGQAQAETGGAAHPVKVCIEHYRHALGMLAEPAHT